MYTRRMKKVVKMPTAGQHRVQVPQVVMGELASAAPQEVHVTHTHRHVVVPWEALDPRGFRDVGEGFQAICEGILAIEEATDLRRKRNLQSAGLAAICALMLPLVMCGTVALIRYATQH